jgi:hypothetical protein
VEGIASKSPKELTALIESVSGSDALKETYEEAVAEKCVSVPCVLVFVSILAIVALDDRPTIPS